MKFSTLLQLLAFVPLIHARSGQHVGKDLSHLEARRPIAVPRSPAVPRSEEKRQSTSKYLNSASRKYVVNGTNIPDVDFDIGESYAGLMPISNATNSSELYFWFFPSSNPNATKEILIWLNGGPGCSSLEGLLQENGPFLWQYGTYKPVRNPWAWTNLTNTVWVEQPVGTGFSQGTVTATSDTDVAAQFLGFFKNFINTFSMQGYTVYIAGESYAGYYVPYIADAMFNANDTTYYNLSSIMIYDPTLSSDTVQEQVPAVPFVERNMNAFAFNESFMTQIQNLSDECGYTAFYNQTMNFPPTGPLPTAPNNDGNNATCDLWDLIADAAMLTNPCFDYYQVFTTCPLLWDVLGFPGSFSYLPAGASVYFNRTDVQKAINAPLQEWEECTSNNVYVNGTDNSVPSASSVLPSVIERAQRTIIGHGLIDYVLIWEGTLIATQNMTWHGTQGFSTPPNQWADFYVPYHDMQALGSLAAGGIMGNYHTERNLTLVNVRLSGHMIPQYAPSAAYRQLEFLLGRIPSLGTKSGFTTLQGSY